MIYCIDTVFPCIRLCSTAVARKLELKSEERLNNGYPDQFIMKEGRHAANPPAKAETTWKQASLPYARGVSKSILRIFKNYKVQICHIYKQTKAATCQSQRLPRKRKIHWCHLHNSMPGVPTGNLKRWLQQHSNDVAKGHTVSNALAEHHEQVTVLIGNWLQSSKRKIIILPAP